ncbi:MAG: response regulator [Candidatus Eisenbacteria bacterium]
MNDDATQPARKLGVLIVDDSSVMRALIKRVTLLTGFPASDIHEAANGAEALQLLQSHHVDVMFVDINMPVMNGAELLQAMRGQGAWNDIIRVVVSTDGSEARRTEMSDLGVRFYLEKPIRPEGMRDVLAALGPAASDR